MYSLILEIARNILALDTKTTLNQQGASMVRRSGWIGIRMTYRPLWLLNGKGSHNQSSVDTSQALKPKGKISIFYLPGQTD
jgi:hypothetical protein